MKRLIGFAGVISIAAIGAGCAVTEPDGRDTARVRAAVAANEHVSIADLASDLGISHVAVVAALPESMRVEVPTDDLREALVSVSDVTPVYLRFYGISGGSVFDAPMEMGVEHMTGDQVFMRHMDGSPSVHFAPDDIASIWLCRMRGGGRADRAILFFGSSGERLMAWEAMATPASVSAFDRLWSTLKE